MSTIVKKIDDLIELLDHYSSQSISTVEDAFVVVTKWPTKGKSKTRLSKCIGSELAVDFSLCVLKDLLLYFSTLPHSKFLLFAPQSAKESFALLLTEIGLTQKDYKLIPMHDSDLSTSNLGDKLSGCISDIRSVPYHINGSTCLIGSDCIELRHHHIFTADVHSHGSDQSACYIIPAEDGGYVLIDLPAIASPAVFQNVLWSNPKTCESQIASIERNGMKAVKAEFALSDVDEMEDWLRVCSLFGLSWDGYGASTVPDDEVNDYKKLYPRLYVLLQEAVKKQSKSAPVVSY